MADRSIHILPPDLANRIAAGEVVQRPASVVKELVENALDAGARSVRVIVRDAGRTLLQVVDDGSGMSSDDAVTAFERHATSKIATAADLEAIRTLGFRGEALASIAAVARVELRTRRAADDVATVVRVEGGGQAEPAKDAGPAGTSVSVKNLFFNTPARRNFLKSDRTELRNIVDTVTRAAMINTGVAWSLQSDDEVLLDVPPQDSRARMAALLGASVGDGLLECRESTDVMSVEGFIARPSFARKSRSDQYIYLNSRPIVNKMVAHAVFQAYEHLLIHGGYPLFMLNLILDPRDVDVNVHPSKQEVKFGDDSAVYRLIRSVVRRTLSEHDLVPEARVADGVAIGDHRTEREGRGVPSSEAGTPIFAFRPESGPAGAPAGGGSAILRLAARQGGGASHDQDAPDAIEHRRMITGPVSDAQPLWQIENKYIVSQVRTGLVIVDQHVAHERVLYERVKANFENDLPAVQQLLFPEAVELSATDYALVTELDEPLRQLGFDIRLFGKQTVIIEGIPADVKVGKEKRILQDVLEDFKRNDKSGDTEVRDRLAKSYACKAAIKAGDPLSTTEMKVLIEQLFLTRMPYVCPHGRPVVIRIPTDELDRRFGRPVQPSRD